MLPPKRPGQSPPNASSPSGAAATRPSIGSSGTVIDFIALPGRSTVPVMRCAVEPPDVTARGNGSFRNAVPPSGTSAPKRPPCVETAVSRLGRTFSTSTTSVSPGSAPSIAIGPTSPGHLPPGFSYHSPQSDSLSSTSPGLDGKHRRAHRERRMADRRLQAVGLGRGGGGGGQKDGQHQHVSHGTSRERPDCTGRPAAPGLACYGRLHYARARLGSSLT